MAGIEESLPYSPQIEDHTSMSEERDYREKS